MIIKTKIFERLRKYNRIKRIERALAPHLPENTNIQYIYNTEDVYALVSLEDTYIRGSNCTCPHVDYFHIEDISGNSAKATKLTGKLMGEIYDCTIEHRIKESREGDYLIRINSDCFDYVGDSQDSAHLKNRKPQITLSELNQMCESSNQLSISKEQENWLPSTPTPISKKHFILDVDSIVQKQITDRMNARAKHERKRKIIKAIKNGHNPKEITKEELC